MTNLRSWTFFNFFAAVKGKGYTAVLNKVAPCGLI